jgi:O-antigen/teichoic acid export membrane protein
MKDKLLNLFINNKKFAVDTIWLLISQAVVITSGILIVFLITKYLGLVDLGYYNQIISFYNILSIVFALGLNNAIIKNVAESTLDDKNIKEKFSNSLFLTLIQSLSLSLLMYFIINIFPNILSSQTLKDLFWIMLLALPFYNINKNIDALCTGKRNQKKFSTNKIIRWITMTTLVWLGCLYHDIQIVIASFAISEALLLLVNLKFISKYVSLKINKTILVKNFKFGLQTYIAEMISVVISNIDIIILGYILSKYDLGLYSLIITIARTMLIFPNILSQNINPIISKLWFENKKEELFDKFKKINKMNLVVCALLFLGLLAAYWLVITYFKPEYYDSFYLFIITLVGIFITSTISWAGGTFMMIGKNKLNNIRTFVVSMVSLVLMYFITLNFGLYGACLAVVLNALIQFIIFVGLLLKLKANKL